MSPISALNQGLEAIQRNVERVEQVARRVSRRPADPHLAGEFVRLQTAQIGVRAGAGVVRAADEITGTLLDVTA